MDMGFHTGMTRHEHGHSHSIDRDSLLIVATERCDSDGLIRVHEQKKVKGETKNKKKKTERKE